MHFTLKTFFKMHIIHTVEICTSNAVTGSLTPAVMNSYIVCCINIVKNAVQCNKCKTKNAVHMAAERKISPKCSNDVNSTTAQSRINFHCHAYNNVRSSSELSIFTSLVVVVVVVVF